MRVRRRLALVVALAVVVSVRLSVLAGEPSLLGFSAEGAGAERALEARFDATLKAENLRDWLKRLAARPHALGSAYGRENAQFIAAQLTAWGFETRIETFDVLFPTPKVRFV